MCVNVCGCVYCSCVCVCVFLYIVEIGFVYCIFCICALVHYIRLFCVDFRIGSAFRFSNRVCGSRMLILQSNKNCNRKYGV